MNSRPYDGHAHCPHHPHMDYKIAKPQSSGCCSETHDSDSVDPPLM